MISGPMATPIGVLPIGGKRARRQISVSHVARFMTVFAYLCIAIALGYIWIYRSEDLLIAESGLGYALGIAGVVAMVALLTYPLRKRLKLIRNWGSVATWFHVHMLLGILAPALILAHSSFSLGSLNSSVALISMLIVAASGLIGRYLYTRIHFGLYGARATLEELTYIFEDEGCRIGQALAAAPSSRSRLIAFATAALKPANNLVFAGGRTLIFGMRIHWVRFVFLRILSQELKKEAHRSAWSKLEWRRERKNARLFITNFLGNLRKIVQLTFYERLFALWHVLHLPFFFMLLIATTVHIIAVHMY